MKQTFRLANVAMVAMAMGAHADLNAQDVLLSEVCADGGGWVEIHNRSVSSRDLSSWCLYYATGTVGMPQNYWWAFPNGTVLAPDQFIRVFWFQNAPASVPVGEYYTGTSPYGYLFSLGGEALHAQAGAFALIDTQLGAHMSVASHFVDWVTWGQNGFPREDLAVQNGTWSDGRHLPPIPAGSSIARNVMMVGVATTRDGEWFVDPTPTPMGTNITGQVNTSYGQSCTVPGHHLVGQPTLRTTSLPLLGNPQFGFVVENTTGFFGESMLLALSTSAAPSGQQSLLPLLPGSSCVEAIHTGGIFATFVTSTQIMATTIPMSLAGVSPALAGVEFHAQALVFDWLPNAYPPFQGISNARMLVIGQ